MIDDFTDEALNNLEWRLRVSGVPQQIEAAKAIKMLREEADKRFNTLGHHGLKAGTD